MFRSTDLNRANSPPPDTLAVGLPGWRTKTETRPRDSALVRPARAVTFGPSADLARTSTGAGIPSGGEPPATGPDRAARSVECSGFCGPSKTARKLVAVLKNDEVKANRRCI